MKELILKSGTDNLLMQRITFGAGSFDNYSKKDEYFRLLDIYYGELGGRSIDTARAYSVWKENCEGMSEKIIGEWLLSRGIKRDEIVITTKGGFPFVHDYHEHRLDRKTVREDMEKSLDALKLDYVDVYLLHRDTEKLEASEMLDTMSEFVSEGKTRFIGISNWKTERIKEANDYAQKSNKTSFAISQINFSLAKTTPQRLGDDTAVCMDDSEYKWYLDNKFPVMAYSSQSKGYFSKLLSGNMLSDKCKARFHTEENIERAQRVRKVSEETGLSPAAIAILYLSCNEVMTSAIFCPSSEQQLRDTMTAKDATLSTDIINYLDLRENK